MRRPPVRLAAALLALAASTGCKSGPMAARTGAAGADGKTTGAGADGSEGGAPPGSILPRTARSDVEEKFFRIDTLISQWDAAQHDGDADQADGLAGRIAAAVDGDMATFASASRGEIGVKAQTIAVQALGFSRRPEATDLLVAVLTERDAALVGNALIGLKLRADPATPLPPLVDLLRAGFTEARRYASLALANVVLAREKVGRPVESRMVSEAMTGLVGLIRDRDPYVRLHAAKAMGALRQSESIDFLVLLLKDEHPTIRIASAAALERVGDPRAFPPIIALLDDMPPDQKPFVREILVSFAERLQAAPLSEEEKKALDVSPRAWDRWFASRDGPHRGTAPAAPSESSTPPFPAHPAPPAAPEPLPPRAFGEPVFPTPAGR